MRLISVAMLGVLLVGACKKEGKSSATNRPAKLAELVAKPAAVDPAKLSAPALFANIPADTPYVFAAFEAIPLDYWAKVKRAIGPALDEIVAMASGFGDGTFDRVMTAIDEEMNGQWTAEGFEKLGFSATPRFALYGHGLQPVVWRMEVKNDKTVLETIERVAAKAQVTLPQRETVDGRTFWRIRDDVTLVVALVDNQLVIAGGRDADVERFLPQIIGKEKPQANMADGKALANVMTTHGFGPHMIGFVDTKRLAAGALELAQHEASPACASSIDALSARVPRVVFGYSRIDNNVASGGAVVELAPDLIEQLRALKAEIPGIEHAVTDKGMLSFAMGANLERGRVLMQSAAGSLHKVADACNLPDAVEALAEMQDGLSTPIPAPFDQLTGFVMTINDIKFSSSGMPQDVDGAFYVTARDAKAVYSTINKQLTAFGMDLGLKDDGKLHAIKNLPIPLPIQIEGGVGKHTMVVATGNHGVQLANKALAATPSGVAPFMLMSYDYGKFAELQTQMARMTSMGMDPLADAEAKLNEGLGKVFGRAAGSLDVNDKGLAFWGSMELK